MNSGMQFVKKIVFFSGASLAHMHHVVRIGISPSPPSSRGIVAMPAMSGWCTRAASGFSTLKMTCG